MSDETTARDRVEAMEVAKAGIAIARLVYDPSEWTDDLAAAAVLANLQANPEVLRALAGAPTADVAALLAIAETARRMYAATDAGDRQDAANASRTLRDLLAAAPAVEPEGMDVEAQGEMADELTAAQEELRENEGVIKLLRRQRDEAEAAIQRVRDVLDQPWDEDATAALAAAVGRALDGDTTEES